MKGHQIFCALSALCTTLLATNPAYACSRFTYDAPEQTVVTGRSMDWMEDLHTDLWVFPAGITRTGDNSNNAVHWVSKYGSLIAAAYNLGAADGVNSAGLNANLLYLSDADYGASKPERKNLSVFKWLQYALDNYATVDEAVKDLGHDAFNIAASRLPNGALPTVHLALTDKTGDNAIFEYVGGHLVIHHGKQFNVMTNEPPYNQQLALNAYWQKLKGTFLPGTGEPEDRFVRASYYLNTAPQTTDPEKSVAIVFSILRDVSVPMSASTPTRPNVAATLWRSVADLKHHIYYFENTDRPNVFWIDINKLDLKQDAPVKKLPLAHHEVYAGEVSQQFVPSKPTF